MSQQIPISTLSLACESQLAAYVCAEFGSEDEFYPAAAEYKAMGDDQPFVVSLTAAPCRDRLSQGCFRHAHPRRIASPSVPTGNRVVNLNNNPDIPPEDVPPAHQHHAYTSYERMVLANVSMFHKNFNAHDFDKNGQLVADDIRVHSNGTELRGREAFVSRIKRYLAPFPDLKINDLMTIVDGNRAAIRYVMTGTHTGDLVTPEELISATQRKIAVDGSEWFTFDLDGKLIDLVTIVRNDQLMMQLRGG